MAPSGQLMDKRPEPDPLDDSFDFDSDTGHLVENKVTFRISFLTASKYNQKSDFTHYFVILFTNTDSMNEIFKI
jgi:hypothetical protein